MAALVVYESMYGSAKAVAQAIAEGLAPAGAVYVYEVSALAKAPGGRTITIDLDLLVVGGPTHAFGLSRPTTRQDAAKEGPGGSVISQGYGLRDWLNDLTLPLGGIRFAAFDTKVVTSRLPGSVAKAADKQLRQLGCRAIADPRTFGVIGKTEGLVPGELEKAHAWGAGLAGLVVSAGLRHRRASR